MMIAKLKGSEVFHRISSSFNDNAVTFCEEKGVMNWEDDSEVITCPKCEELHRKMTMNRLHDSGDKK